MQEQGGRRAGRTHPLVIDQMPVADIQEARIIGLDPWIHPAQPVHLSFSLDMPPMAVKE